MGDYPDPDEEFELMYGDDLDALRDQEDTLHIPNPARRSLDFSSPAVRKSAGFKSRASNKENVPRPNGRLVEGEANDQMDISGVEEMSRSENVFKKRDIEELFGDLDDLEDLESQYGERNPKKMKYASEEELNLAMIKKIMEERRRKSQVVGLVTITGKDYTSRQQRVVTENVSLTMPRWPYITVTKSSGEKLYVRCHNEEFMEKEMDEINDSHENFKDVLNNQYKDDLIKAKAFWENLKSKNVENSAPNNDEMSTDDQENDEISNQMWVEKYKPMRYMELLSDESTNRILLHWLKMWDKVVFDKEVKLKKADVSSKFNKRSGKFEFNAKHKSHFKKHQEDLFAELDEDNRPKLKVALLCGAPGCGKTTLAHLIARHAGYNPVEVNASDDRNIDAFKLALENNTQMKSVLDSEKRPNCLILDEIDGAPTPTIEFLVKFISGSVSKETKKGQKSKMDILKRPIICICNDIYTPSLRSLKQIAFVVHFPPIQITRLTQRLSEISKQEGLKVDSSVFTALGERTQNDIRSCLGILHFFKIKKKDIRLTDLKTLNIGEKDMVKGLFQVWQDIFQIQLPKHQRMEDVHVNDTNTPQDSVCFMKTRRKAILNSVQSYGDYEKLTQGVHENFLDMKMQDSMMISICQGMDWFLFNDILTTRMNSERHFVLFPYLAYGFVAWHFLFAGLSWPKIKFPTQSFETYQKHNQLLSIVTSLREGMNVHYKPYMTRNVLVLDTLPLLPHIICPSLRPVNIHLYSEKEKKELSTVVGVMLDYGLQYTQERSQDGIYNYNLDPDILKVGVFDEKNCQIKSLSYALKQLISGEVALEQIKKNVVKVSEVDVKKTKPSNTTKNAVPNHLQTLQPKKVKETQVTTKDFFGRTVVLTPKTAAKKGGRIDDVVKSPIWYHYKEGYNNAVRRDVKISDLL